MLLKDIVGREVETATPDMSVSETARRMMANDLRVLPVCKHGVLVGVLTRRDLFMRASNLGDGSGNKQVGDIMDHEFVAAYDDEPLVAGLIRLRRSREGLLFVLTRDRHLAGIVDRRALERYV